jgi:hypothetical protein
MSQPALFGSVRPLQDIVASLGQQVAEADAAMQIEQQRAWNQLVDGRALLAGYDRLANLGVEEVRVTLGLVAVRPGWFRRLFGARRDDVRYRPARAAEKATLDLVALIRRDAQGRWETTSSVDEISRGPVNSEGP